MTATLPTIDDADIDWVCKLFRLPANAFSGADGNDPRAEIIKCNDSLDVEACPGSGKTTMLVAKLAVLARHWSSRRQGICVLSHTNAARHEVERRLSSTAEGQKLLSYPHYIGTIHAFVNEFLAIPWLRSEGIRVETVDDEICLNSRWRSLQPWLQQLLESKHLTKSALRYQDENFDLGDLGFGKFTKPYTDMQAACRRTFARGIHCYEEMFIWARQLMSEAPEICTWLRDRFPILFVDEVQDNRDSQSALLHQIFIAGTGAIVRQRFGDSNQAIYRSDDDVAASVTVDSFPDERIHKDVVNSFRFGQSIADLADPLAVRPQGLRGLGGRGPNGRPEKTGRHAIFLFDEDAVESVLPTYASYLLEEFEEDELKAGDFTAIGAVHRSESIDKIPRIVGHYCPTYDNGIVGASPQPKSLVQYIMAGRRLALQKGLANEAVEKIALGILRLSRQANTEKTIDNRRRQHRNILELLQDSPREKASYLDLVCSLAVDRVDLVKADWEGKWKSMLEGIALAIAEVTELPERAVEFLQWPAAGEESGEEKPLAENVFRHPVAAPRVSIRLGSIHSVKGETHTATLVMETYYRTHHLKKLKAWLLGKKTGGKDQDEATQARLRVHYVGMTRPARLLCLSMRRDTFNDKEMAKLRDRGWRICHLTMKSPPNWS